MSMDRYGIYIARLGALEKEHCLRRFPAGKQAEVIDLSSNDYLGLASRCGEFMDEFRRRWSDVAMSSSASRLLAGDQKEYNELENYLGQLYGKPALMFNSGYHANTGIIQALSVPGTIILSDRLAHASMIDGIRLGHAPYNRFHHNDLEHLGKCLEKSRGEGLRPVIVTESVFSMDGDVAPLKEIVALRRDYPEAILYVDEAHGFGTRGERGLGVCEELGLIDDIDIIVGTLGKAGASEGAFAIASEPLRSYFVNTARSLIFSTALAPATAAWSRLMIEKITEARPQRERLDNMADSLRKTLRDLGIDTGESSTHIIPIIIGDTCMAIQLSERLKERGVLALPIRKPTVPQGTERLRLSLSASLSDKDFNRLLTIITEEVCS